MLPTKQQLLSIIETQTMIARLGLDLEGVVAVVAEQAQALTGASGAAVEMVEGDMLVCRAATGSAGGMQGLRLDKHAGLSGLCLREQRTLKCGDADTDSRVDREACRRAGVTSMIVAPLFHEDDAVGVLRVVSCEREAFGDADARVLELMTEVIAAAIYHATHTSSEALFYRATHDGLTGLANRSLFFDRMKREVVVAKREGLRFAVLMVDLDGFKRVNDVHGHLVGDAVLREVAKRISDSVRESDMVARLGGDELGVLLRRADDRASAQASADRIREQIALPFKLDEATLNLVASIGVALFPEDGKEPAELVGYADQRMYAEKRARGARAETADS